MPRNALASNVGPSAACASRSDAICHGGTPRSMPWAAEVSAAEKAGSSCTSPASCRKRVARSAAVCTSARRRIRCRIRIGVAALRAPSTAGAGHLFRGRMQCAVGCLLRARPLHLLQERVEPVTEIIERAIFRDPGNQGRTIIGGAVGHTLKSTGGLPNPKSRYRPVALPATRR